MCGIIVWIKKDSFHRPKKFLEAMKTIHHRGPDSKNLLLYTKLKIKK